MILGMSQGWLQLICTSFHAGRFGAAMFFSFRETFSNLAGRHRGTLVIPRLRVGLSLSSMQEGVIPCAVPLIKLGKS